MSIVGFIIRAALGLAGGLDGVILMVVGVEGFGDSNTGAELIVSIGWFAVGFALFVGTCGWAIGVI